MKVLLENYGYTVIDLGRDVDPAAVVEAARKHEAPLVGLSALMTHHPEEHGGDHRPAPRRGPPPARSWWGGRGAHPRLAPREIHADFYAKDAKESVDIAKQVIG